MKGFMGFAVAQGYRQDDPWTAFKLPKSKSKHSAQKKESRRPFTAEEVHQILDYVSGSNAPRYGKTTIDYWGPWIAAHHGTRIQEVCQLRLCDFAERDGVWSMHITDEGEGMRAKSSSSVRWVPVHPRLIDQGLKAHVEAMRKGRAADAGAFEEWEKKHLRSLQGDNRGRVSGNYGKRFGRLLREKLKIDDKRAVFHSFRHRLQDAADSVGIPDAHRRDLPPGSSLAVM